MSKQCSVAQYKQDKQSNRADFNVGYILLIFFFTNRYSVRSTVNRLLVDNPKIYILAAAKDSLKRRLDEIVAFEKETHAAVRKITKEVQEVKELLLKKKEEEVAQIHVSNKIRVMWFFKMVFPPHFQNKVSPCISYSYTCTRSVDSNIFNYKEICSKPTSIIFPQNPLPCTCPGSEFLYAPCGHEVTGDLSIVQNEKLKDLLRKGPKFREPVSFSWQQNDIIMDDCAAYVRKWAKKEDVERDTLSKWIKSIGEVVKRRIRRPKHSVNTRSESICRDPDVVRELSLSP